jgi:putative transposase
VAHYNEVRLHSAIACIAPLDKLQGRGQEIHAERDRKLHEARERRKTNRAAARLQSVACVAQASYDKNDLSRG